MMADNLMTKTAFAAVMGVDKAQPTRWAALGMPEAAGGRLDPVAAAAWVRENVDPSQRIRRSNGAAQEAQADRRRQNEALDMLGRLGVWLMCQRAPLAVVDAAAEVGIPLAQIRALHDLLLTRLPEVANEVRDAWMGLPAGETGPFTRITHMPAPDWENLFARYSAGKLLKVPDA